jgi:DNA-binding CsgD family transcriptional regulator
VLRCRPVESEGRLAYAGLADLLAEVPDSAMAGLPAPQRRALEVALLRAEPEGEESLPLAVGLGVLGLLRALAEQEPTLVAIDDVQWLDHPSESALSFALRRLGDERVGLLCVRRAGERDSLLADERALPAERLALRGLDRASLGLLLRARFGPALTRRTLARVERAAGGNLFYALEIGRALVERGARPVPTAEPPIPAGLQELVRDRLAQLPSSARAAAQAAAALSRPRVSVVEAATSGSAVADAGAGTSGSAVADAVEAGVLERDGERLHFAHPLLAAVAYGQLSAAERRALHARLAEIVDDAEERARLLALAADAPDEAVASALQDAARRAAARGAPDSAAELLEQARGLTPRHDADAGHRRGIEAAERYFEAGDVEHARRLLEEVVAQSSDPSRRAHALARLGWVRAQEEGFRVAADVFFAALLERTGDVRHRIEIEQGVAWCLHSTRTVPAAAEHARAALALAEDLGDPAVSAGALGLVAFLDSLGGEGVATATAARALALGQSPAWSQILGRPDWVHALLLSWVGALDDAHAAFDRLHREALDRGDEHSLPFILFHLARVAVLSGDWTAAQVHARDCHASTVRSGQVGELPYATAIVALVDAHVGRVEAARAGIEEGLDLADRFGSQPAALELLATRGFLELSLGDATAAEQSLDRLETLTRSTGFLDPGLYRFQGDAVEAKIALGHHDEARRILDELERVGKRLERTWPLAIAARGRGLLSSAEGDAEGAYRALEQALRLHDRLGQPFERARTLLALGSVRRRDRKKQAAREALGAARGTFESLGAALWADRARREGERIGGRATADGLTATEARVAELLASGLTYRQAADALFVSPKTVQWNVSKIYRKLGTSSRAELVERLTGGSAGSSDPAAG